MALILIIETATPACSVAVAEEGILLASVESKGANDHSQLLAGMISDLSGTFPLSSFDAVAVSRGPGSYTGLRIGASTGKGLCYALDKPLLAIDTLLGMAAGALRELSPEQTQAVSGDILFCPMIDARRMEVYCAVYSKELTVVRETAAVIIDGNTFSDLLAQHPMVFFGNGAGKTEPVLGRHANVNIVGDFNPRASHFAQLAESAFQRGAFEDVAYFEPFYLKDFIAGAPKVKGLR